MAAIYLNGQINYSRVYLAAAVSVIAHIAIMMVLINKEDSIIYVENGVRAVDTPRLRVSISKVAEPEKIKKIVDKLKPLPVENPVVKQEIVKKTDDPVIDEVAEEEKFQEAIPLIKNATFKGTRTPPLYPKRALMLNQEGVVILQALIDVSGSIKDVKIVNSSGHLVLDKSAIDAVWKWKFEPSIIDGKASLSWVQIPVEFIIK
ncbi:TonB family protein [Rickettsiales bacterium]|nr:TonB family protein [Rickettsiales bacterium]